MHSVRTGPPPTHSQSPASHGPEPTASEAGYELWIYLGAESVFFYPPGSVKEHLVVDHGIPSVDMHWNVKGRPHDHERDHRRQQSAPPGTVGDLLAVTHAHAPPA